MSSRPGPLARTAIAVAVGVGVLAVQAFQPLSMASAQTRMSQPTQRPAHLADYTPPKTEPRPWSAKTARPASRTHKSPGAAALRRQAIAQAGATEKIASYRVSPAFLTFLTKGVGMPLGQTTLFTGVRSGAALKTELPAPQGLRLGLPAGVHRPSFGRSALTIDPVTGAATVTASASDATLNITVPDAASTTLAGLTGELSLRVPVLGEDVTLSGPVSYQYGTAVSASLSGQLPASADLGRDVAELGAGTAVTLDSGGLRVAGPASLGPPGRQLDVTVSGVISGKDGWTLTVRSAGGRTPLPGLELSPDASGTVTDTHGRVSFDVRARTSKPWTAARGVTASGLVTFADNLPNGALIPAPGITGSTAWIDITGTITASGVTAHGTAAINLASGKGLLTSSGKTLVTVKSGAGKLIGDNAGFSGTLDLSPAGRVGVSLPTALAAGMPRGAPRVQPGGVATARSVAKKTTATAADVSDSYTLSGPVYNFITNSLNIPLGSDPLTGTLSGSTLTLSASAPTALPGSLPPWIPNPSYLNTQITVDEATNTLTLTAATGTSSGETATLTVTIANASTSNLSDGTDVSGSLGLAGVPFTGGSTVSLTSSLGYADGAVAASLSGALTSPATFANGTVTIEAGTSLTLATGFEVTINGGADITTASGSSLGVAITGTLSSFSNWSLSVSDASAQAWQPAANLTVIPDFTGSIADNAGMVSFELASTGSTVATWHSPDDTSTVNVTSLEVSNLPASGPNCSTSQVGPGDVWIGIGGSFSYSPANLSLNASGCFDLTGESASITTAAAGDLTSEFGSSLPFTVTAGGLTASIDSNGSYSLIGTATVVVTQGVSDSTPSFNVGLSLSNSGIVGALQLDNSDGLGLSGDGVLYVATQETVINPADFGLTNQPVSVSLPPGLSVSLSSYTLPSSVVQAFSKMYVNLSQTTATAMATLSSSGFTIDLGLDFGAGANGVQIFNTNGSAFYLNDIDISVAVGAESQVTLAGTGFLELPALVPDSSASQASVTVSGYFNITTSTIGLSFNLGYWSNALGIQNLNAQDFGGSLAVTVESGIPTPVLGIAADNIVLPPAWAQTIGLTSQTKVSFNGNFSVTQPVLGISIVGLNGQPALLPLAIATNPNLQVPASVVNSFTVSSAVLELAPDGWTTPAGDVLQPGISVIFDANIDSVPVHVDASVDPTALSVTADVAVGAFTIGPVQTSSTRFYLDLSSTSLAFGITGAISYNGDSFTANIQFALGTTMAAANITLSVTGGLPSYFQGGVSLSGAVSGDGSGASVDASGSGWLSADGSTLGPVSFSLSIPNGLSWSDVVNSITRLAQFFVNAGLSPSEVVQAMQQFGYGLYDTLNALSEIGDYSSQTVSALASAFGFSTTYFDIWTYTFPGVPLVMDVSGGSQSPPDANVITWTYNSDYNQDWAFVPSQYPDWYEIVNRGTGQCLTVYGNNSTLGNLLIQYPCGGALNQLWDPQSASGNDGSLSLDTTYSIWSALDYEVADVQNAYPWQGGYLDQWSYNDGSNQQFWLTNSTN